MTLKVITMKSIKVTNATKNTIKNYTDGTYDESVQKLIEEVKDYLPLVDYEDNSTVINLKEETVELLKSYRLSYGESIENILIRMLIISQILNTPNE